MLYSGADRWLYILSEMNDILAESAARLFSEVFS